MIRKKKILVVDDTDAIRKFLKLTLESNDFEVVEGRDGQGGIDAHKLEKPDVIILDLGLPDMDGIEVLESIRNKDSKIPVIILTVRSDRSYIEEAQEKGANAYITKPFQVNDIIETIETVC